MNLLGIMELPREGLENSSLIGIGNYECKFGREHEGCAQLVELLRSFLTMKRESHRTLVTRCGSWPH